MTPTSVLASARGPVPTISPAGRQTSKQPIACHTWPTRRGDRRRLPPDAACPDDQQIIGGGLTNGDNLGFAHVESMRPFGSPFQELNVVGGIPLPSGTYDWNLAAWAVCVDL